MLSSAASSRPRRAESFSFVEATEGAELAAEQAHVRSEETVLLSLLEPGTQSLEVTGRRLAISRHARDLGQSNLPDPAAVELSQALVRLPGERDGFVEAVEHRQDAALVTRPAGERILGELAQLSARAYPRLAELGLLEALGGSLERLDRVADGDVRLLLVGVFGDSLQRLPISNQLRRYARCMLSAELPIDLSRRAIHRFRRATEPWATDAVRMQGGAGELMAALEAAHERYRGAAAPWRRARASTRAGDRTSARAGRGGAGGGDDLVARRGAGFVRREAEK